MKDYSDYLNKPGMLDYIEKEWIEKPEIHDFHAMVVNDVINEYKRLYILEVGCGTGNLAKRILNVNYVGIDSNPDCIKAAKEKDADKDFYIVDVRNIKNELIPYQLVFTFGFLKHFGLHEWSTVFKKVCSLGEYLVFNMPIAEKTHDDGEEYHHVWMSLDDIRRSVDDNGFQILEVMEHGVEPIFICKRK